MAIIFIVISISINIGIITVVVIVVTAYRKKQMAAKKSRRSTITKVERKKPSENIYIL